MFWKYPLTIQSYNSTTNEWGSYTFETQQSQIDYINQQFKVPGEYNLTNTKMWKETEMSILKVRDLQAVQILREESIIYLVMVLPNTINGRRKRRIRLRMV